MSSVGERQRRTATPSYWLRARRTNAVLGLLLLAGIGGVYFYTIRSVAQDDFSDLDEKGNRKGNLS